MELFSRNHLLGTIGAGSQDDVFRALAARAVELGAARSADDIVADYHEREAEASTGFGGGVAIPHSKTDNVSDAILLFARLSRPVEWHAPSSASLRPRAGPTCTCSFWPSLLAGSCTRTLSRS